MIIFYCKFVLLNQTVVQPWRSNLYQRPSSEEVSNSILLSVLATVRWQATCRTHDTHPGSSIFRTQTASFIHLVPLSGSLPNTVAFDHLMTWFSWTAWSVRADLFRSDWLRIDFWRRLSCFLLPLQFYVTTVLRHVMEEELNYLLFLMKVSDRDRNVKVKQLFGTTVWSSLCYTNSVCLSVCPTHLWSVTTPFNRSKQFWCCWKVPKF